MKVRWAQMAGEADIRLLPDTQFEDLGRSSPPRPIASPSVGTLECDELDALVQILASHTGRPQSCWFALWDGYGWLQGGPAVADLLRRGRVGLRLRQARRPAVADLLRRGRVGLRLRQARRPAAGPRLPASRVRIPGRSLLLYGGSMHSAAAFCRPPTWQSPNLWWPEERAWCVASEIDLCSTYVGGPEAAIDDILHDGRLEALAVGPADRIGWLTGRACSSGGAILARPALQEGLPSLVPARRERVERRIRTPTKLPGAGPCATETMPAGTPAESGRLLRWVLDNLSAACGP